MCWTEGRKLVRHAQKIDRHEKCSRGWLLALVLDAHRDASVIPAIAVAKCCSPQAVRPIMRDKSKMLHLIRLWMRSSSCMQLELPDFLVFRFEFCHPISRSRCRRRPKGKGMLRQRHLGPAPMGRPWFMLPRLRMLLIDCCCSAHKQIYTIEKSMA